MRSRREKARPAVGEGSSWTKGRDLGGRVLAFALFGAILCGPTALLLGATKTPQVTAAEAPAPAYPPTTSQSAGDFALSFVSAWLGATRDNSTALAQYVDVSTVRELSEAPWEYRDLAVASLRPADGSDYATVVVGASIHESVMDTAGGSLDVWPRRYFQVVVNTSKSGGLGAVGLPAPVAAPPTASASSLDYPTTVDVNEPVGDSVLSFLNAYLADSGDITRVSSPGTSFAALAPAPYVAVDLIDVKASDESPRAPADGDTVHVLATAALIDAFDKRLTATYALTLTARADRWEISSIDPTPRQKPARESSTTNTPAPADAGDRAN